MPGNKGLRFLVDSNLLWRLFWVGQTLCAKTQLVISADACGAGNVETSEVGYYFRLGRKLTARLSEVQVVWKAALGTVTSERASLPEGLSLVWDNVFSDTAVWFGETENYDGLIVCTGEFGLILLKSWNLTCSIELKNNIKTSCYLAKFLFIFVSYAGHLSVILFLMHRSFTSTVVHPPHCTQACFYPSAFCCCFAYLFYLTLIQWILLLIFYFMWNVFS